MIPEVRVQSAAKAGVQFSESKAGTKPDAEGGGLGEATCGSYGHNGEGKSDGDRVPVVDKRDYVCFWGPKKHGSPTQSPPGVLPLIHGHSPTPWLTP